jgi:predicted ester cyclase
MSSTTAAYVDQVIEYFNRRRMDLPDGFFDRKTQFLINGATFDSLLSSTPDDPLIMMLARGPAGYRFTAKALQHAVPDARIELGDIVTEPQQLSATLRLAGTLRGSGEHIDALVSVVLQMASTGRVETAAATMDQGALQKIREARLRQSG